MENNTTWHLTIMTCDFPDLFIYGNSVLHTVWVNCFGVKILNPLHDMARPIDSGLHCVPDPYVLGCHDITY